MDVKETIARVDKALLSTLELDTICSLTECELRRIFGVEAAELWVVAPGPKGEELLTHGDERMAFGEGIIGGVATAMASISVPDAYCDRRHDPAKDRAKGIQTRNVLASPVILKGELLGVVQLTNKMSSGGPRPFTDADEGLLLLLCSHIALAICNAKLQNEQRHTEQLSQHLMGAMLRVTAVQDDWRLCIQRIISTGGELVGAAQTALFLRDESDGFVKFAMAEGSLCHEEVPLGEGIAGSVALGGHTIRSHDLQTHPDYVPLCDEAGTAVLCVPLIAPDGQDVVGVLQAVHRSRGITFSPEQEQLLRDFAATVVTSLGRARSSETLRDAESSAKKMSECCQVLATASDEEALLRSITEQGRLLVNGQRAELYLQCPVSDELVCEQPPRRIPMGVGIVGQVAQSGKTINSWSYADTSENNDDFPNERVLCAALRSGDGEQLGVLKVCGGGEADFTDAAQKALQVFGVLGGASISRLRHQAAAQGLFTRIRGVSSKSKDVEMATELQNMIAHALSLVQEVVQTEHVVFEQVDAVAGQMWQIDLSAATESLKPRRPIQPATCVGQLITNGADCLPAHIVPDAAVEEGIDSAHLAGMLGLADAAAVRDVLCVAARPSNGADVVAVVQFVNSVKGQGFSKMQARVASELLAHLALVMMGLVQNWQAVHIRSQMVTLLGCTKGLLDPTATDPQQLLLMTLSHVQHLIGADRAVIHLADPRKKGQSWRLDSRKGSQGADAASGEWGRVRGVVLEVLSTGDCLNLDTRHPSIFDPEIDELDDGYHTSGLLAVPLSADGQADFPPGVIEGRITTSGGSFSSRDQELLVAFCGVFSYIAGRSKAKSGVTWEIILGFLQL